MILGYVLKLDLNVSPTNLKVQKINSFSFKIFGIIIASFQVKNKLRKQEFF